MAQPRSTDRIRLAGLQIVVHEPSLASVNCIDHTGAACNQPAAPRTRSINASGSSGSARRHHAEGARPGAAEPQRAVPLAASEPLLEAAD